MRGGGGVYQNDGYLVCLWVSMSNNVVPVANKGRRGKGECNSGWWLDAKSGLVVCID